jgi:hypothetical protein
MNVIVIGGNAFALDAGALMSAPVYANGTVPAYDPAGEWCECIVGDDLSREALALLQQDEDYSDDGDRCTSPSGHTWAFTGTAYGGDDESYRGEGRCYCTHCGADGDA